MINSEARSSANGSSQPEEGGVPHPPSADANGSVSMATVRELFEENFGRAPTVVVRAPGRVNLIGEHIDYNGYPVLPIAIEQSIFLAASLNDSDQLRVVNADEKFANFTSTATDASVSRPPLWHDYTVCGALGAKQDLGLAHLSGMDIAVMGTVPQSAGLSSSSAMVCAAATATMALHANKRICAKNSNGVTSSINGGGGCKDGNDCGGHSCNRRGKETDVTITNSLGNANCNGCCSDKRAGVTQSCSELGPCCGVSWSRLAQVCASSEKLVGTEGGGMDQAACLLSKEGCAQLISFNPLRCEEVTLPTGATFVVANSLQNINKAATSDFNCRVMECKLACHLLAKVSGLDWEEVPNMASLQAKLNKTFDEMLELVKTTLHEEPYSVEEVARALYISQNNLTINILSKNTQHIERFLLRSRALHVFSEAQRVYAFRSVCDEWRDGDRSLEQSVSALGRLGDLMAQAHWSASRDYECSHAALDRIVELSSRHALGARLTGAGWGGCTVALVPEDAVGQHCAALASDYYSALGLDEEGLQRALFTTAPAKGAELIWC